MPPIQQRTAQVPTPRTRSQLEALVEQRDELRGQLRSAEDRRASLAVQSGITPAEQRGAVTQRIAGVDAQIQGLETRLSQLDEAITRGMSNADLVRGEAGGGGARGEGGRAITVPPVPPVQAFPEDHETVIHVPPPLSPPGIHPETVIVGVLGSLSMMALVAWVTWKRAKARFSRGGGSSAVGGANVTQLQQSVDAIALEVERISENQRFLTKVLSEREGVKELAGREEPPRRSP